MNVAVPIAVDKLHHHADDGRLPAYSVYLDCIRAGAAFLVLAGHARSLFFGVHTTAGIAMNTGGASTSGPTIPGLGTQAVIVFFVLSGFLVGGSAWRAVASGRWSWKDYLLKRLTRLWIVLIPALLAGACLDSVGRLFLHNIYDVPAGQAMIASDWVQQTTVSVLIANALYLQGILVPTFGTNVALWSLANEFWYYMAFPLLLLTFLGRSMWKRCAYGLLLAGILLFVGRDIAVLFTVWLMGAGVARLPLKLPPSLKRIAIQLAWLQFLGLNLLLRVHPFYAHTRDLMLGASFSLLLYMLLHARQPIRSLAFQRAATTMSSFSYSLYLFHLPMLVFLTGLVMRPWHAWPKDGAHLAMAAALVGVTYCYAYGLFWLFERRTDLLRNWLLSGWLRLKTAF